MISRSLVRAGLALAGVGLIGFGTLPRLRAQAAGTVEPALYSGLKWRMVGPFRGGRVNAVTGVPGDPNTFYFGSVGGGVWKSIDAGRTWNPIFDQEDVGSIGAIGVAPSNPDVVYVGTGEADMRDSIQYGDGMYKSTDAGKTWTHIGLEATRQIGRVIVDPRDPNLVFVAALGHAYAPNPDRGVYRSTDGGATWQKVLFKGDTVGAIDLTFDPSNSKTIYAALWAVRRPPWFIYAPANEPGGGIFKSTDDGDHWTQLTSGLPTEGIGRIGLSISASNPQRIYAVIDAKQGGLYRSDDAGATWTLASGDQRIWGRGWYFETVTADPKNADTVYIPNTGIYKSSDGGKTWGAPIKAAPGGDDYHNVWIAPEDSNRLIFASDQGTAVSLDGAKTWSSWYNQPTAQLYHVAPDYRFPYWLTAAQQDSGAVTTPIRAIHAVISMHEWTGLCAGGESGYTAPDPLHPDIVFGGTVEKCNVVTGATKNVSPERNMPAAIPLGGAPSPESRPGAPRHDWTQPLVFSQADPHALYFADQFVFKTTDGGESWTRISDDLTREDPGVPPNIDAVAAQDAPPDKRRGVVYTIAPSPIRAPLIWIGTDDGLVKVTPDGGKTWNDVTPKDMTSWTKVVMIEASHFDADEAFVAAERHQLEDYAPHIYRTRDGGKTWQSITRGLPGGVYVQTVKEDPVRRGLLFCGTERAVYVSFDNGDNWQSLQLNLPPTSMRDLAIKGDDLIVATHGRGFWALDDMTLLRQIDPQSAASDAVLFKPAEAVELPTPSEFGTPLPKDEPFAENPPTGAIIDYYLKSAASGPVTLEIVDGSGAVVRRYSSEDRAQPRDPNTLNIQTVWAPTPEPLSGDAGMHRWVWDLRQPNAGGGRGRGAGAGRGGRGAAAGGAAGRGAGAGAGGGGGFGRGGAPVASGPYTVRLTVNGKSYTQPIVVKPDPRGTI